MNEDALIAALAKDLRPVRRLWAPPVRMLVWLLAVLVMAGGAAWLADMDAVRARMAEAPDLRYSLLGSVLTAGVAGLAALELSVPGRSGWWVAAPVLPGVLWFGASGWGCLEAWRWPGLTEVTFGESVGCFAVYHAGFGAAVVGVAVVVAAGVSVVAGAGGGDGGAGGGGGGGELAGVVPCL